MIQTHSEDAGNVVNSNPKTNSVGVTPVDSVILKFKKNGEHFVAIRYLHPNLQMTRTLTGRLATSGFPVLGLPKHSEEGRKFRGLIRAPEGYVIYEADYSQIELRTLAHLSEDPAMIKVYREGGDIHCETAEAVFGVPPARQDDSKHRLPAKTGNFSMVMGTTESGLTTSIHKAGNLEWSKNCPGCKSWKAPHNADCDSLLFMRGWFDKYRGARRFMDARRALATKTGKAVGMWGMEWTLPGVWSPHEEVREATLRQSHALPIQEGAQRLIKQAMARVHTLLVPGVSPILQIHDSLVFVVKKRQVRRWHLTVKRAMEEIAVWKVPIVADGKAGPTWLSLEKLK